MVDAYLITTVPDYDGFSIVEVHLVEADARARVDAANSYADTAPPFPPDDADHAAYDAFSVAEQAWREGHPFGPDVASGYLLERYTVMPVPLRGDASLPTGAAP